LVVPLSEVELIFCRLSFLLVMTLQMKTELMPEDPKHSGWEEYLF